MWCEYLFLKKFNFGVSCFGCVISVDQFSANLLIPTKLEM
jgi:hypothetical protein